MYIKIRLVSYVSGVTHLTLTIGTRVCLAGRRRLYFRMSRHKKRKEESSILRAQLDRLAQKKIKREKAKAQAEKVKAEMAKKASR